MAYTSAPSSYHAPTAVSVTDDETEDSSQVAHFHVPLVLRETHVDGERPSSERLRVTESFSPVEHSRKEAASSPQPFLGLDPDAENNPHLRVPDPMQASTDVHVRSASGLHRPHQAPSEENHYNDSSTKCPRSVSVECESQSQRPHGEHERRKRPQTPGVTQRPRAHSHDSRPHDSMLGPSASSRVPRNRSVGLDRRPSSRSRHTANTNQTSQEVDRDTLYSPQPRRPWRGAEFVNAEHVRDVRRPSRPTTPKSRPRCTSQTATADAISNANEAPKAPRVGPSRGASPSRRPRPPLTAAYGHTASRRRASGSSTLVHGERARHHHRTNTCASAQTPGIRAEDPYPYSRNGSPNTNGGRAFEAIQPPPALGIDIASYPLSEELRASYQRGSVTIQSRSSAQATRNGCETPPNSYPTSPTKVNLQDMGRFAFHQHFLQRFERRVGPGPVPGYSEAWPFQAAGSGPYYAPGPRQPQVFKPQFEPEVRPSSPSLLSGHEEHKLRRSKPRGRLSEHTAPTSPSNEPQPRDADRQQQTRRPPRSKPSSRRPSRRSSPTQTYHMAYREPSTAEADMEDRTAPPICTNTTISTEGFLTPLTLDLIQRLDSVALHGGENLRGKSLSDVQRDVRPALTLERAIILLDNVHRENERNIKAGSSSFETQKPDTAYSSFLKWVLDSRDTLSQRRSVVESLSAYGIRVSDGRTNGESLNTHEESRRSLKEDDIKDLRQIWETLRGDCQRLSRQEIDRMTAELITDNATGTTDGDATRLQPNQVSKQRTNTSGGGPTDYMLFHL